MELKAQVDLVEMKIREVIQGTLAALRSDLDSVGREEAALLEEQRRIEKEMSQAGKRLTQFKRLDAELVAAKEVYNSYLKKEGETSATSGSGLASIDVVDWAKEPTRPYKPRVLLNLAVARRSLV